LLYVLKQKLFSWGDDFYIRDYDDDHEIYFVDGKAFTIGDQLSFQDLEGNELAFIKQKVLSWGRTYELYRNGIIFAVVKKELFSPFQHTFNVDVPGPDDLKAEGNFLDMEYKFTRAGNVIASVTKQWLKASDTYEVAIDDAEDQILLLACTVIIDMSCHGDGRRR
jgi:uncharacterized protein YxjI